MKKFLLKISLFCIPLILFGSGVELFYRKVPNNFTAKHKGIQVNDTAKILVLGNSHSFYGFNPSHFNLTTFNLANVSQGLQIDEVLLNKHFDSFNDLKYIVLSVDFFTLSQNDGFSSESWRLYFYEEQMELETGLISDFDIKKYSLALATPFKITANSLKEYYKKGTLAECNPTGYAGLEGVGPENRPDMGRIIADKHEDGSTDFRVNIARLTRIIEKCKAREVKVLLVTMPVTTYYADEVNKDKLSQIIKECESIDTINQNVKYLNLFQDNRFNNSDFHDVDHLNSAGAKKCSEIVNNYILSFN